MHIIQILPNSLLESNWNRATVAFMFVLLEKVREVQKADSQCPLSIFDFRTKSLDQPKRMGSVRL